MDEAFYEIREEATRVYVRFPRYNPDPHDPHPWDMRVCSFPNIQQALCWICDDQYEDIEQHPEYAGLPIYWNDHVLTIKWDEK